MANIESICVYCGSKTGNNGKFSTLARNLGHLMAEQNIRLVYGGGSIGLMGIIARAVMEKGGSVTGVIPGHLEDLEVGEKNLTDKFVVNNMHERKRMMFDHSDAFVILPGSIGTLDETIEMVTWKQLQLHDKPIILLNADNYWDPFIKMLKNIISEGFMTEHTMSLFEVISDLDELLPLLEKLPEPKIDPKNTLF
ncbi:TIGR00730 family Rossman fold protein [Emcibacter sp.]|uniref:LOG family protein n=1 Tax=Emcibacter sp. TaxID=1979954 RepID=UPI002AA5E3DC|nr:TIGR00730 family Rossman fold protein [Emcibacter sp.]